MSSANQPATALPGLLIEPVPFLISAAVGLACGYIARPLPDGLRMVIGFDAFALSMVLFIYRLMSVATAEQCAELARRRKPRPVAMLVGSAVISWLSIAAIAAMMHSQKDQVAWVKTLHLCASMLAIVLTWLIGHAYFGMQYMRLYYRNPCAPGETPDEPELGFPNNRKPDLWDFMYYSYTIAMCYQTSDIDTLGVRSRHVTLMHSIYSFFYVAAIVGFVVNVLSNML